MHIFFWVMAFLLFALYCVTGIGAAVGVLPLHFGVSASILCLLLCLLSAYLADRGV